MRKARIIESTSAVYHVMSRVVDKQMVLDEHEKQVFYDGMRAMEGFSGLEVITYAILDNHFHILLHVPERQEVSDEQFIRRLGCLYGEREAGRIDRKLAGLRKKDAHQEAEELRAGYTYRMYSLSEYMKTLKQRFTQDFNDRHDRRGTLWEERYKSLLVEPDTGFGRGLQNLGALATVAAYIDLNAVRAGLVDDPKDYRYCGYGEAMAGGSRARLGLDRVVRSLGLEGDLDAQLQTYRMTLFASGEAAGLDENGRPLRRGFSPEQVREVLEAGGLLPVNDALRCRVLYFSNGAAVGSADYVEEVFHRHREQFDIRRTCGAVPMIGAEWGGMCTARPLSRAAIVCPARC